MSYTYDSSKIEFVANVARLKVPQTSGTILINDIYNLSGFISLAETVSKTGSDDIHYQMKINGVLSYYNGSAWAISDGSFAKSNSVAEVNGAAGSMIASQPSTLQLQMILKGSGTTTPSISGLEISYDANPVFTPIADKCTIYCTLKDITDADLTVLGNAPKLVAVNDAAFMNGGNVVPRFYIESAFSPGDLGLIASMALTKTNVSNNKIRFMVTYEPDGRASRVETVRMRPAVIPDLDQISLTDLTSIDTNQLI